VGEFPHVRIAREESLLDAIQLVSSIETERQYREKTEHESHLPLIESVPSFGFGITTQMALAGVLGYVQSHGICNKKIVIIGYDTASLH
jgi:hypothetical protein